MNTVHEHRRPHVVIIGGGFGGLSAAQALRDAPVDITLVDRRNHHLFQPLLYQVATAQLSPAEIAVPIRKILNRQKNVEVILAEVSDIDTARCCLSFADSELELDYTHLIVATGATHSYFGKPEWASLAPGLKTIEDATEIRRRFLLAFEGAEVEADPDARRAKLTFVVVGGGPTGIEMAGALAEIARTVIPKDFRTVDTTTAHVILVEGQGRLLPSYPPESSEAVKQQLEQLGVEVLLNTFVTEMDDSGVQAGERRIDTPTIFWAAGVQASPLGKALGAEMDRVGHVIVKPDLTIESYPEVFVIGDLACAFDGETGERVPGVAQGAIQMGRYVAGIIKSEIKTGPSERRPFTYKDKGNMATIGRNKAVAVLRGMKFKGLLAWLMWALIHVLFLVSFRNRISVLFSWVWTYFFYDRGARLITGDSHIQVKVPRDLEPMDESSKSS